MRDPGVSPSILALKDKYHINMGSEFTALCLTELNIKPALSWHFCGQEWKAESQGALKLEDNTFPSSQATWSAQGYLQTATIGWPMNFSWLQGWSPARGAPQLSCSHQDPTRNAEAIKKAFLALLCLVWLHLCMVTATASSHWKPVTIGKSALSLLRSAASLQPGCSGSL